MYVDNLSGNVHLSQHYTFINSKKPVCADRVLTTEHKKIKVARGRMRKKCLSQTNPYQINHLSISKGAGN